jgi:hypothetical protein
MPFVIKRVNDERLPVEDNDNGATAVTPSSEVINAVAEATGIGRVLTPYRLEQWSSPTLPCVAKLACPGAHPIGRHDRGGSPLLTGTASPGWLEIAPFGM